MPSLPGVAQGTLAFVLRWTTLDLRVARPTGSCQVRGAWVTVFAKVRSNEIAAEHDNARWVPELDKLRGLMEALLVSLV